MGEFRLLKEDPTYEKIRAQRQARAARFMARLAKYGGLGCAVLGFLAGSALLILLGTAGIVAWIILSLRAQYLDEKYIR